MLNYPEILEGFGVVDGEGDPKNGKKGADVQIDGVLQDGEKGLKMQSDAGVAVAENTNGPTEVEVVRTDTDIGVYTIYCPKSRWKKKVEGDE